MLSLSCWMVEPSIRGQHSFAFVESTVRVAASLQLAVCTYVACMTLVIVEDMLLCMEDASHLTTKY